MFRRASLFIGTSFTVAVFTIFTTSNIDSIVGIPHKIYSMLRILIHIKSRSLCWMCPSAPRVCSEPGDQKPVPSLSLDRIEGRWRIDASENWAIISSGDGLCLVRRNAITCTNVDLLSTWPYEQTSVKFEWKVFICPHWGRMTHICVS